MKKLIVNFENCFWIWKLENHKFDFTNSNVNLVYAKNWSMKTSFTKVFEKYQLWKENEIKDEIHNNQPVIKEIKVVEEDDNERNISQEEIYVIKSFKPSYESKNIATLLVNDDLKENINEVLILKKKFLKLLEKDSWINIEWKIGWKIIFKLEPQILKDFNIENESFLKNLNLFNWEENCEDLGQYYNIKYSTIFDAIDIIKKEEFQNNIEDFIVRSEEIYNNYSFLKKWEFTLAKLKKIQWELNKQSFFVNDNKIKFWNDEIDKNILKEKIEQIEQELQETDEFKALEKLLQKPKWIPLKDIIESNSFIIEDLKLENLECLKIKLWKSYFKKNEEKFSELKTKYSEIEEEISEIDINTTIWKKVIDIFNDRFFLPFRMEIWNIESSIMWEALPKVIFKFPKDWNFENNTEDNWTELNRENLEDKDVLSQWEIRALYLLNIIFDIETIKKSNQKILFIIDDIADSFDYKNKYAIVEYLKDLSENPNFYLIILTHNFDFFRFVSNRLKIKWNNKIIVKKEENKIKLKIFWEDEPWKIWKQDLNIKNIIALIPFVRNLVEYGINNKEDYLILTHLLHIKETTYYDKKWKILKLNSDNEEILRIYNEEEWDFKLIKTEEITFDKLLEIYKKYLGIQNFNSNINLDDKVYENIFNIELEENLEDKIIYWIKIRYKAEEFMINKINNSNWFYKISWSQTNRLFKKLKWKIKSWDIIDIDNEIKKTLEKVNIMTPENIHLNSFMYEPILDMDIIELKELYERVKLLDKNIKNYEKRF